MKCPECGKAHRKFPQDCVYRTAIHKVITDDASRYIAMRDYCKKAGLMPASNP